MIDTLFAGSTPNACCEKIAVVAVELVSTLLQSHTKGLPARAYRIDVEGKWIEDETLCPQYA